MSVRAVSVSALMAAAAMWPVAMCALVDALRSPVERLSLLSWCGVGPSSAETLRHCALCWTGSAVLLAAAVALLLVSRPPARRVAA